MQSIAQYFTALLMWGKKQDTWRCVVKWLSNFYVVVKILFLNTTTILTQVPD